MAGEDFGSSFTIRRQYQRNSTPQCTVIWLPSFRFFQAFQWEATLTHTQTQQNTCTKVGCHICLLLCRMHELMPETSNAVQWLHFKNGIICTVSKLIKHAKDIRKQSSEHIYFAHGSGYELLWYVCLCVCLSARISPEPHTWSLPNFLCMLPMSVARSSSGMLTIGRIADRREGAKGVHSVGEV